MTKNNFGEVATDVTLQRTTQALAANGMTVRVAETLDDARQLVLGLVPAGSEVFTATSMTLQKTGLADALNAAPYISLRNKILALSDDPQKRQEMRRLGTVSDYALGSVHAVTEEGEVLLASATGSQLPNYSYGADHVIWVVGTQKIVADMNQAMQRLQEHVFPQEDIRSQEAYGVNSSINQMLIFKKDYGQRITIVFVKQSVGF